MVSANASAVISSNRFGYARPAQLSSTSGAPRKRDQAAEDAPRRSRRPARRAPRASMRWAASRRAASHAARASSERARGRRAKIATCAPARREPASPPRAPMPIEPPTTKTRLPATSHATGSTRTEEGRARFRTGSSRLRSLGSIV